MTEFRAALDPWMNCILKAAMELDDGKSDATSVAIGVEPQCAREYQSYRNVSLSGISFGGWAEAEKTLSVQETQWATSVVLMIRSHTKRVRPAI
jgi:hypothetical protein